MKEPYTPIGGLRLTLFLILPDYTICKACCGTVQVSDCCSASFLAENCLFLSVCVPGFAGKDRSQPHTAGHRPPATPGTPNGLRQQVKLDQPNPEWRRASVRTSFHQSTNDLRAPTSTADIA